MASFCRALLLVFAIPLLLSARQQGTAQPPNDSGSKPSIPHLDGAWTMYFDDGQVIHGGPSGPSKRVILFKSTGSEIQVLDPSTKVTSTGKADGTNKFTFYFPIKDDHSANAKPLVSKGSISGNTMLGVTQIEDKDVHWKAVKVLSAWECSNHKNPSHVATSEEEMRELTKQYMCAGWHKVPTN